MPITIVKTTSIIPNTNKQNYIVTIPEWLSISQTKRIFEELNEFKVRIGDLIMNQVVKMGFSRDLFWKNRAEIHEKYLKIPRECA